MRRSRTINVPLLRRRISRQYLRDFSRIVKEQETVEGIVSAMLDLHGDRDNQRVISHCAREAVKKLREA